jgi:hypothetical protein
MIFAFASSPAIPQARDASIEDAAWLAGRWVGGGLGGRVEESWSPPQGGQMVGHFSLVRGGTVALYEMMLLDLHEGGLRLRVKHFNPDFTGWEARDGWHVFEPRASAPGDLRFDGLRYHLEDGALVATVAIRRRADGPTEQQVLRLRRSPL